MINKVARVTVLVAALAALAAGGLVIFDAEQALKAQQSAGAAFDAQAQGVLSELMRLRTAQQAYVAEGQGPDYWMAQAADALAHVDRTLAALTVDATGEATRSAIQATSGVLEDFRKLDGKIRQYVKSRQLLMASDVIFTDAMAASTTAIERVNAARVNEASEHEAGIEALRWRQFYAASGAAGVLLLAVLLLAPVPERDVDVLTAMRALTEAPAAGQVARPRPEPMSAPAARAIDMGDVPGQEAVRAVTGTTSRRMITPPVIVEPDVSVAQYSSASEQADSASQGAAPVEAAAESTETTSVVSAASPVKAEPTLDLSTAARVCSDMARVLDAGDLPALLARAAGVLDAPGMVVWVADRNGQELFPLLTYGYSGPAVVRIGSIPTEADNATATAWRTGEPQAVPGDAVAPGALVAPIVTAEGCVGVLAAELREGRESRADVRALAAIFAAQLATFVTALPTAGGEALAAEA